MARTDWDVIVLGGGAAGLIAARAARARGARNVALVERDRLGGECTHTGCVPSKALIDSASLAHAAAQRPDIVGPSQPDFRRVMERVRSIVQEIADEESATALAAAGIAVLNGSARFHDGHHLKTEDGLHRFGRCVIATGSSAAVPPPLAEPSDHVFTNESIFGLDELPASLVVVGGGPIGAELGQAFGRLGSGVTIVEQEERLLPTLEPDAAAALTAQLEEEGVTIRTSTSVTGTAPSPGMGVELNSGEILAADAVLVAVGRRPRMDGLGLENVGVETEDGGITTDRRMRTTAPDIYAAGDVTPGGGFTHLAAHQGLVAGQNAAGHRARINQRVAPAVTFTDPEIAIVGLSPEAAREKHRGVEVATFAMEHVDRARTRGRTRGYVRIVTAGRRLLGRTGGGVVVGGTVVGDGAGELIHEIALAMHTRMFAGRLAQMIHAYPSASTAVQQSASQLFPIGRDLAGPINTEDDD